MRFDDFRIAAATIQNEWSHNTEQLAGPALQRTDALLRSFRSGMLRMSHGVRAIPDFEVMLGLPIPEIAQLDPLIAPRMVATGRFFCIATPKSRRPFQLNLVLPRTEPGDSHEEPDRRAIATLLVSSGELPDESVINRLWDSRPFLATVLHPYCWDPNIIGPAADFATCFAASMLLRDLAAPAPRGA